ncbi:hypothetical protein IJU97_06305 [bacterium]|nr:hypothetical protein [bacterium]
MRLYESRVSPSYSAKYVIQDALDDIRTGDSRYSDLRDALEDDYEKAFSTFKKRRA